MTVESASRGLQSASRPGKDWSTTNETVVSPQWRAETVRIVLGFLLLVASHVKRLSAIFPQGARGTWPHRQLCLPRTPFSLLPLMLSPSVGSLWRGYRTVHSPDLTRVDPHARGPAA